MSRLPTWACWSIFAAVVLLFPAIALLLLVAGEIIIDLVTGIGMPTLLALIVAGGIGRLLFRKLRMGHAGAPVET